MFGTVLWCQIISVNSFFCLLKIPAWPRTVQPHLEPEDKGRAAGRSGGGDARLQRGPWAWKRHRHLLEPPGIWGLCSARVCCTHCVVRSVTLNQCIMILPWTPQRGSALFLKLANKTCLHVLLSAGEIRVPFRWDKDRGLLSASASRRGWKWRIQCHQEIVRIQKTGNKLHRSSLWTDLNSFSLSFLIDMSSSTSSTIAFC